jgi:predicted membrane protein (TIGR00267 family)
MIVTRLTQHPDIYLYEMVRDEFGIDPREADARDLRAPIAMGVSFVAGSFVPIVAYFFPISMLQSTLVALSLAVVTLFGVGYYAAGNTQRNPLGKGMEIVLFGVVVFVVSYLAGHYIPPLFGLSPMGVAG